MQLQDIVAKKTYVSVEAIINDAALAKQTQINLIRLKLLAPPADGKFGPISIMALRDLQSLLKISEKKLDPMTAKVLIQEKPEDLPQTTLNLGNDLASRICSYMVRHGYDISQGPQQYNIVCIEAMNADGSLNDNMMNEWNARRIVIEVLNGVPSIIGNWAATTRPGLQPDEEPPRQDGCAFVAFGQYKAWSVGQHYGSGQKPPYEALVQTGAIDIWRDVKRIGSRSAGKFIPGSTGNDINLHHGWNASQVGWNSEGCLTDQSIEGHQNFMTLCKSDKRYLADNKYQFQVSVFYGAEVMA